MTTVKVRLYSVPVQQPPFESLRHSPTAVEGRTRYSPRCHCEEGEPATDAAISAGLAAGPGG